MSEVQDTDLVFFELRSSDFLSALVLWESADGVVLRDEDRDIGRFEQFLARNPKLSWGVRREAELIAAVMAGHDGRRGYIYHLAIAPSCRDWGVGRALARKVEQALADQGVHRAHVHVARRNLRGQLFWKKVGWEEREELVTFSQLTLT